MHVMHHTHGHYSKQHLTTDKLLTYSPCIFCVLVHPYLNVCKTYLNPYSALLTLWLHLPNLSTVMKDI